MLFGWSKSISHATNGIVWINIFYFDIFLTCFPSWHGNRDSLFSGGKNSSVCSWCKVWMHACNTADCGISEFSNFQDFRKFRNFWDFGTAASSRFINVSMYQQTNWSSHPIIFIHTHTCSYYLIMFGAEWRYVWVSFKACRPVQWTWDMRFASLEISNVMKYTTRFRSISEVCRWKFFTFMVLLPNRLHSKYTCLIIQFELEMEVHH